MHPSKRCRKVIKRYHIFHSDNHEQQNEPNAKLGNHLSLPYNEHAIHHLSHMCHNLVLHVKMAYECYIDTNLNPIDNFFKRVRSGKDSLHTEKEEKYHSYH